MSASIFDIEMRVRALIASPAFDQEIAPTASGSALRSEIQSILTDMLELLDRRGERIIALTEKVDTLLEAARRNPAHQ